MESEEIVSGFTVEHLANQCACYFAAFGMNHEVELPVSPDIVASLTRLDEMSPHNLERVFKAAKNKNPDLFSFKEAMHDRKHLRKWLAAALKEITQLETKGCWEECMKTDAVDQKIIPCTWVFTLKRNPAGEITKRKARICLRGDLMLSDEESYAPVVSWSEIRMFLVLAMMMNWQTISIDWNNAFIQATLKTLMYMHTPRGLKNKHGFDGCLKLVKSLVIRIQVRS